ncbi:MAG: hypothetical protein U1E77_08110 [Inhella sp.]
MNADDALVYLVDDEDAVRDALAFLLGSRGLTVRSFASGPELLAALDGERTPPWACSCSTYGWSRSAAPGCTTSCWRAACTTRCCS